MKRKQLIDIVKQVYEEGGSLQIPLELKSNGKLKDSEFFHTVFSCLDDEPITIISKTKTEIVFEVQNNGLKKMLESYEKLINEPEYN